ncbi:DUF4177 domain-containing protein [Sporosarcina oncorhynchi]|uniref:DUF4177 domain-containing protein n=1 Tax=Sporosarcina oncorhynchi TaxID=3056444 RepID=UPI003D6690A8
MISVYEYQIKSIKLKHTREGFLPTEDYTSIITRFAEKGWRFVQLVDFSNFAADEQHIDLVFERTKK